MRSILKCAYPAPCPLLDRTRGAVTGYGLVSPLPLAIRAVRGTPAGSRHRSRGYASVGRASSRSTRRPPGRMPGQGHVPHRLPGRRRLRLLVGGGADHTRRQDPAATALLVACLGDAQECTPFGAPMGMRKVTASLYASTRPRRGYAMTREEQPPLAPHHCYRHPSPSATLPHLALAKVLMKWTRPCADRLS